VGAPAARRSRRLPSCAPHQAKHAGPSGRRFPPAIAAVWLRNRGRAARCRQSRGRSRRPRRVRPQGYRFRGCGAHVRLNQRSVRIGPGQRWLWGIHAGLRGNSSRFLRRAPSLRSSRKPHSRAPPTPACRAGEDSAPARPRQKTRPRPRGRCWGFCGREFCIVPARPRQTRGFSPQPVRAASFAAKPCGTEPQGGRLLRGFPLRRMKPQGDLLAGPLYQPARIQGWEREFRSQHRCPWRLLVVMTPRSGHSKKAGSVYCRPSDAKRLEPASGVEGSPLLPTPHPACGWQAANGRVSTDGNRLVRAREGNGAGCRFTLQPSAEPKGSTPPPALFLQEAGPSPVSSTGEHYRRTKSESQ